MLGQENQGRQKRYANTKITDAMGDDAKPGMRDFFLRKRARRRNASQKMPTFQ